MVRFPERFVIRFAQAADEAVAIVCRPSWVNDLNVVDAVQPGHPPHVREWVFACHDLPPARSDRYQQSASVKPGRSDAASFCPYPKTIPASADQRPILKALLRLNLTRAARAPIPPEP